MCVLFFYRILNEKKIEVFKTNWEWKEWFCGYQKLKRNSRIYDDDGDYDDSSSS